MWKIEQLLQNAQKERKGDYRILAEYIDRLKNNSDTSNYVGDLRKLKAILEVEQ